MQISIDWVKDFVELPESLTAQELAEKLTLATCEVEGVQQTARCFEEVRIAEIKSIRRHPDSDKLNLVTYSLDESGATTGEVVCGAPNVREGLRVPFAPLGVTLPNGMTLEPKKIRGVLSQGMLCSAVELGLGSDGSGLMDLGQAPLGQTMLDYLGKRRDVILDIDNKSLTHRPDLWGHMGFAREFATIYDQPLKQPYDCPKWQASLRARCNETAGAPVVPVLEGESSCLGYWGITVDNVHVAKGPLWLEQRLASVGLRSINNIVDISNYVMLELGIPLHIFDRAKITGDRLVIKRLGKTCQFQTLDGVERELVATDTVISDQTGPLVLAGVMGGASSEVDANTRTIFIEVANWRAAQVRRTSTRLGLRTESSQRYEKSLDSQLLQRTLLRTLDLVFQLCPEAKVVGQMEYAGPDWTTLTPLKIPVSYRTICRRLGKEIEVDEINRILQGLGFGVSACAELGEMMVEVPSYRATKDIECAADIVEEIGRIIGYGSIAPQAPLAEVKAIDFLNAKKIQRKIQDFLVLGANCLEIMTYPLVGLKLLERAAWPQKNEHLVLKNALSQEAERMRPSLIPSLLEASALNAKNYEAFRFFEIGRCWGGFELEKNHLGVVFASRNEKQFIKLTETIENLMGLLNLPGRMFIQECERLKGKNPYILEGWPGQHPHEFYHIQIRGQVAGAITTVHPYLLRDYKIRGEVAIAILDLSLFEESELKESTTYRPLPKYPASIFDVTVVVGAGVLAAQVLEVIKKAKIKELIETKVVTVFDLEGDRRALTVRTTFADETKTLESELIKKCEEQVMAALIKAGFPLRAKEL